MQKKIMDTIADGDIKMKSRSYFLLRTSVWVIAGICLLLLAVYIASVIIFVMHRNGSWFVPGFGATGVWVFLRSFPWVLALLIVILLLLLELFIKKSTMVYRRPLVYSLAGLFAVAVIVGFFAARAPFHGILYERAQDGGLPVVRTMYHGPGMLKGHRPYVGEIVVVRVNGFDMMTYEKEAYEVTFTQKTKIPKMKVFRVGDVVVVMGEEDDGLITAFGVKPVSEPRKRLFLPNTSQKGMQPHPLPILEQDVDVQLNLLNI